MTDERLDAALAALPREIDPARDLWPDIRARIVADAAASGRRPSRRAPAAAKGPSDSLMDPRSPAGPATAAGRHLWLRAAAMLLTALGAGAGVLAVRGIPARPSVAAVAPPTPVRLVTDAGLEAVLNQYAVAAHDLMQAFRARHTGLDPAARAAVERALHTIDAAIADLRAALATHPDPAARTLLEGAYRQKLDLLTRALRL